jgi:sugar lactone lactonase YvrE
MLKRKCYFVCALALVCTFGPLDAQSITTVAGTAWTYPTNVPAVSVPMGLVGATAVDAQGNVYAPDSSNNVVVKITPQGVLTVVAGNGIPDFAGNGGPATKASLFLPTAVALDAAGNLYISDSYNNMVRKVSPAGIISTFAGTGAALFDGDNVPAITASLSYPAGLALDSAGNLYIADATNQRIRKVSATTGLISTVAGNGKPGYQQSDDGHAAVNAMLNSPLGVAVDATGNVYIADCANSRVRIVSPAGIIATYAGNGGYTFSGDTGLATNASLDFPNAVALDSSGNLYIADSGNQRIRMVSATTKTISTVAGDATAGFSGDGPAKSVSLGGWGGSGPLGVTLDSSGNLYIADTYNYRIRKVSGGNMTTIAGSGIPGASSDGGSATSAVLGNTLAVATDSQGNVYVAETFRVRKISGGKITTVAGNGTIGYSGDGGPATSAQLSKIGGITVDSAGSLYIATNDNEVVRKVSGGKIFTVAGNGGFGYAEGQATSVPLAGPGGMAVDSAGNLYIADRFNNRIRKVSGGVISTVAGNGTAGSSGDGGPATKASLAAPSGVAVDAAGNLYLADLGNGRIRVVSASDGTISTLAQVAYPVAIAVDNSGSVYVADQAHDAIVKVAGGNTSIVAGNGLYGFSGDGGAATSAALRVPSGVAVDATGNLYIADTNNNRVREVLAGSPFFTVTPSSLTFAGALGAGVTAAQTVVVASPVTGATFTASSTASWLKLNVADAQTLNVSADPTGLAKSTYNATIALTPTASGVSVTNIPVTFTVSDGVAVTVTTDPAALTVVVDAVSVTAPSVFNWAPGSTHTLDTATVQVSNSARYLFADWSNGFGLFPNSPLTITVPTIPVTYTASFISVAYLLTTKVNPANAGTLTATPSTIDGFYSSGATPTLTATPAPGFAFSNFSGDLTGTANSQTLTMTAPRTVTANFVSVAPLTVTPSQLTLTAAQGANASANLQIDGGGGQTTSLTTDQPWLRVTPSQGNPTFTTNVTAVSTGLAPGPYTGNALIGGSLKAPVTFTVTAPVSTAHLVPNALAAGLQFQLLVGSPVPGPQTVTLASSDGSVLSFTANVTYPAKTNAWVNLSTHSGQTPGSVDVSVNVTALGQTGSYTAQLVLSTPSAPDLTIPLTVLYSQPPPSSIRVDVPSFRIASAGDIQKRSLIVSNSGPGALPFQVSAQTDDGHNWLTVTPTSASTADVQPAVLQVATDPAGLPANTYTGVIQIQSGSQAPLSIPVIFAVGAAKMLYTADKALNYSVGSNYTSFPPQPLELVASGSGPVNWQAQTSSWITLSPSSGQVQPNTVLTAQITFDLTQLSPGNNSGNITITSDSSGGPLSIPVVVQLLPSGIPVLLVQPTGMAFVAPALDPKPVQFIAAGTGRIVLSANQPWLSAAEVPGAATPPAHVINVSINPGAIPAGTAENRGTITIQDSAGNSRTVSILVYVPAGAGPSAADAKALAACMPSKLISLYTSLLPSFDQAGGAATSTQLVMIDDCGRPVSSGVTGGVISNRDPQLDLRPLGNGVWKATWHPVTPGSFVSISAIGADPVNSINPNTPVQALTSVVGMPTGPALTPTTPFQTTAGVILPVMAPGMQVQINGQNLMGSDGSSPTITLGGEPVQLVSVTGTQVVMVTPPDLSVNVETQLVVQTGDGEGVPEGVIIAPEWPSVVQGFAGANTLLITGLGRSGPLAEVEGVKVLSMEKLPQGLWRVVLERPLRTIPDRKLRVVHSSPTGLVEK